MKRKNVVYFLAAACIAGVIGGCGSTSGSGSSDPSKWQEMGEVIPITRENGSGTRSSFAEALGLNIEGVDDQDEITESAQTETSGEDMLRAVAGEKNGIGYVTYSTDLQEGDGAKEITIDGQKAEDETIEEDSYPLTRTLYLAHTSEDKDLETDFINYVTGKGQETVSEFFVPIGGKEVFLSNQASGTLKIHGSTTLAPVIEQLADDYEKENSNAQIEVEVSDSSKGITDVLTGKCDIAMVSRQLYQYETEVLEAEAVAKDGIRVIVNEENPTEDISMDTLEKIYTGKISKWENTQE